MKNIVVIGGGSGIFNILIGLKKYDLNITSIVSMADNGGSTGILRNEFGILPPGDIRRSLVALSDSTNVMKDLFQYRFEADSSLRGHSFGNLFLTALKGITGSDEKAILEAAEILKIRGKVLPVTLDNVHLCAKLENGETIKGETDINIPKHNSKIKEIFLEPKARAYFGAVKAINDADIIVIGPGDLYTSIIPNLLVDGIKESIIKSKAKKIYICNLMTKHGETDNFSVSDFFSEVEKYLGNNVIDFVVYNDSNIPKETLERYTKENQSPVLVGNENKKFVKGDFVKNREILRHDPDAIARFILDLCD